MRFNEGAVKYAGRTLPGDREGRLQYRSPKESYRQRWFKLKGNLLFYFRTNDMGQQSEAEPIGVLLLERCEVKLEPVSDRPFVFSVEFEGEPGRLHYFSGQTQQQCEDWVTCISMASFEALRAELLRLKTKVQQKTGKNPLEDLYNRLSAPAIYRQPQVPPPRVPTRAAPSPPQPTSVFYNNGKPELMHGSYRQSDSSQDATRPWVKTNPRPLQSDTLLDTARLTHNGRKDQSKSQNAMSGWEVFD